ncbi:MAG: NPCBM/NEW2 domain-containing protein [Planctomycetota bacterium]|jgi:hypothetical protein
MDDFSRAISTTRLPATAVLALLVTVAMPVRADMPDGEVVLKTIHETVRGQLISVSMSDGATLLEEGHHKRVFPIEELVRVDLASAPGSDDGRKIHVSMVGGDRLRGTLIKGQDEQVILECLDFGRVAVPLEIVKSLDTSLARSPSHRQTADWFNRQPIHDEDAILLSNGDILTGFITAIDPGAITVETPAGDSRVDFRLVISVRYATAKPPDMPDVAVVLSSTENGRLTLKNLDWNAETSRAETWYGMPVNVAAHKIRRMEFVGGRWQYLERHEPLSHEQVSLLSLHWPYRVNRSVLGGPIRVAGRDYDHGLGVHSRSKLIFDLRGEYTEFVTFVGLDDSCGQFGDVDVAVHVDGQRRFEHSGLRPGSLVGPIRVDLAKARTLELFCDFGGNGDIQDRLNWVEAALIRAPGTADKGNGR